MTLAQVEIGTYVRARADKTWIEGVVVEIISSSCIMVETRRDGYRYFHPKEIEVYSRT